MDRLREVIELMSKLLYENASVKIKAEVFRAAKFNNIEAVEPLWKLLFRLLSFCEFGKVDDITEKACYELEPEELAAYVKREFLRIGYRSADFACVPVDMSDGSRELLLALAWLLHTQQVIYKFSINCTSLFDDDTTSLYDGQTEYLSKCNAAVGSSLHRVSPGVAVWERVEQLLIFNNKLRMSLRSLYSAQCERIRLKHKLHEATAGLSCSSPSVNHLSMFELYMLRHPDVLKKNIELLDKDSERLQHLLRWKELEGIFWKWMESVIDAKQSSAAASGVSDSDGNGNLLASETATQLTESHSSLQQAILKYESIIEHLERVCEQKIESVSSEDIDSLLTSISIELSQQKASLAQKSSSPIQRQAEPRFVLDTRIKHPQKRPSGAESNTWLTSSSSVSSLDHNIDEGIASLQLVINDLETEITAVRQQFDAELRSAGDRLQDSVCIPPLDSNFAQRFINNSC